MRKEEEKTMAHMLKKGQVVELTVEDLAFGAKGVAHHENLILFVKHGIPGQKIEARIDRLRKNYGEASIIKILRPSQNQVEPPCLYFGICGGCQLQHLDYNAQTEAKTHQVQDLIKRIGGCEGIKVNPIIPADTIYGYRNKMEFTFSNQRWILKDEPENQDKSFALGLHVPGRFDKVLDINGCLLQPQNANQVFQTAKNLIKQTKLEPYDLRSHQGLVRFLVLRKSKHTDELMVNIITSGQQPQKMEKGLNVILKELVSNHPEITTIIHSITDRKGQVAYGESNRLLWGQGKITEKIKDLTFKISPDTFFQTNTEQTERLYEAIKKLGHFQGDETVFDLYSGIGTIGCYISNQVKQVICIEAIREAVENGKESCRMNHISNINFICGDIKEVLSDEKFLKQYGKPDVVILDPPRGGPHPNTIKHLLQIQAPKIIYVSCNPPLMARDIKEFSKEKYRLTDVQPVDMFPHTKHIEVVGLLESN